MKTLILLSLMQLGAAGADAYQTNRMMHQPEHSEHDPIARPFVGSPRGCAFYFSLTSGATIGGAFLLHHHHHDKLAKIMLAGGVASNASGAAWTATHIR